MKKTERVNLIMRYINNRAQFTIREIQQEFGISRATAIRDIQEIEALGFPLVTEKGRNGGYFVLHNDYLPAVRFTPDELRAILISFVASRNSQLPFLQNRRNITEKLIGIASQTQQDELITMSDLLLFDNTNAANPGLLELDDQAPQELNQLIRLASTERHLTLTYELAPGWPEQLDVWVLHILHTQGQWLLEIFDFASNDKPFKRLPIEQLRDSKKSEKLSALTESDIAALQSKQNQQFNLSVRLDAAAIQRFKRMHPPGLLLQLTGIYQSEGFFQTQLDEYDTDRLDSFTDWLLFLGDGVSFDLLPDSLSALMATKIRNLQKKLS